jgi:hypothetical protein
MAKISRAQAIEYIHKTKPTWQGLRLSGLRGTVAPFEQVPDRVIFAVYHRLLHTGKKADSKQSEFAFTK